MIFWVPAAISLSAWSFQDGEEKVTIKGNDVPLITVFKTIKKQAGYNFFYAADYVNDKEKVNVDVKDARVEDVLKKILGKEYVWVYNENAVSITKKKGEARRNSLASILDSSVNQIAVSGLVTDAKGTPIPGATVMVKGTRDGVNTDEHGSFNLPSVAANAVLIISSIGFEKREIIVRGRSILAKLNLSISDLDETVVVAYNTTTQRTNTGAVTVVKGDQIRDLPNRSFDKSLQGQVPGLLVTSGTGQPGGGLSNFVLRGIATAVEPTYGSSIRNPLIIIDGIPVSQDPAQMYIDSYTIPISNPLSQLNPSDIETISILKDAAAIALYGSRASNGVIVVTTKKGIQGKTIFNFRHQTDFASRLSGKVKMLSQKEYLDLLFETYRNTDPTVWSDEEIRHDLYSKFPYQISTTGDTSFYSGTDWSKQLFNDLAKTFSNELSISGGNDRSNFYLNLEYTDQKGIVKKTGYDRKSLRFNFENRVNTWLKFGLNTALSYNVQNYESALNGGVEALSNSTISPLNPLYSADGSYILNYKWGSSLTTSLFPNPVAAIEYNVNRNTSFRGLSKIYGEVGFLKYFTFTSNVGVDFMLSEAKEKVDPRLYYSLIGSTGGLIGEQSVRRANVITTNVLRFDRKLGREHTIGVVLGHEAQILNQKNTAVAVTGIGLPYYDQISSPGATIFSQNGFSIKETLLSFFGQTNYNFKKKYFLSGSIRRDGSSRFGEDKRFGTYWSTGIGWIISSEPFMMAKLPWVEYLKVRGSIGAAGNAASIDRFTRFDRLQVTDYFGNPAVYPSYTPANPNVRWEQTFTWDAGIELRLFKERIALSTDIYKRNTSDLIYLVNLPLSSGYRDVLANIGKMQNKGIEISFSADILKSKNFRWNLNANWSTNKNTLIKADLPMASLTGPNIANMEGHNFNSFYLVRWAGVNSSDGSPQWVDSTGKVSNNFESTKREFVGKPQPDGFGAVTNTFSYKGIELSVMVYYQYGYQIYYSNELTNDGRRPYMNQDRSALNRWQKTGDIAANPKRLLNNPDAANPSTRYLFDGDHIRLQNVTIGYVFAKEMASHLGISSLRIFLQGSNLGIWTKFPGYDPSNVSIAGATRYAYPNQRTFSIGLNIGF